MSHDLCHCEGVDCPLKTICKRYIAHLDAKRNNIVANYMVPQNVGNKCESFYRYYHEED